MHKACFLLFLTCSLLLADEIIAGIGKGSSPKGAKVYARCNALLRLAKKKLANDKFKSNQKQIDKFISENWREYWKKDTFVKFKGRRVMVKGKVDTRKFLHKLKHSIPGLVAQRKARGMKIAIVLNSQRDSSSSDDAQIMLDALNNHLSKNFSVVDPFIAKKLASKESLLEKGHNYQGKIWREFNQIQIMMRFWVKVNTSHNAHRVEMGACGNWPVLAREIFRFRHEKTGLNLKRTIAQVAKEVAAKILHKIAYYRTILDAVYTIKFVGFKEGKHEKLEQAILDLEDERYLKIRPGGMIARSYISYRIKWLKRHHYIKVKRIIKEYCRSNQLAVECNFQSPWTMIFQPPDSNWDGAPDHNALPEAHIVPASRFDQFLTLEQKTYNLKHNSPVKINFRWKQEAPGNWHIYVLYIDTNEDVYLAFPNGNIRSKRLITGAEYSLFDKKKNWGLKLSVEVPHNFVRDSDRILLLVVSSPLEFLQPKIAKLKKGGIATLNWSQIRLFSRELTNKRWASALVNIHISK